MREARRKFLFLYQAYAHWTSRAEPHRVISLLVEGFRSLGAHLLEAWTAIKKTVRPVGDKRRLQVEYKFSLYICFSWVKVVVVPRPFVGFRAAQTNRLSRCLIFLTWVRRTVMRHANMQEIPKSANISSCIFGMERKPIVSSPAPYAAKGPKRKQAQQTVGRMQFRWLEFNRRASRTLVANPEQMW